MTLRLPDGAAVAVAITVDFDGESLWLAKGREQDETTMSKGRYCGEVAAPRLLALFNRLGISTSWGMPVHTYRTWPELALRIARDHEVFCHGVCHESLAGLSLEAERDLLRRQVDAYEGMFGSRPKGYRAPGGPTTPHTLDLLDEFGFEWDSSLAGGDVHPYRPRRVLERHPERGTRYGARHDVLEFSTTVDQEDWFSFEFEFGGNPGMADPDLVLKRWQSMIDWAAREEPGGAVAITLHPQSIGRPHRFEMLERFLGAMQAHSDIWIASMTQIAATWQGETE
ncbi:polysaccharide deacetylase family protein [Microbacterium paludicola]|uniref:polysaccharide deacetylase family protein n=1 Tax=Microbacterium paludicola TaxID=300019 RepID=UPI0011A944D1|nr:polysaccharide deacetylase family protein [Microbacterium paludicola]